MYDHLPYSHYQLTYFYVDNARRTYIHTDNLAGTERVINVFKNFWNRQQGASWDYRLLQMPCTVPCSIILVV